VDAKERPADTNLSGWRTVQRERASIKGGVTQHIKNGRRHRYCRGTPHWFSKIDGSITYIVVRYDPTRVLAPM